MSDPSSTTILLVRHADVHNPRDIVYGRLPRFRLSTLGQDEAARTAALLSAELIRALYCSPMLRARQTAAMIAAVHQPPLRVQQDRRLIEVKTGWQGTSNREMAEKKYNYYEQQAAPDDEDVPTVLARMLAWVARVRRRHPGQVVVGVSHGDPTMMVRLFYSGQDVTSTTLGQEDYYPAKGSITRLDFPTAARDLPPVVTYTDPSAAEHAAQRAAAEAARAAAEAARAAEAAAEG